MGAFSQIEIYSNSGDLQDFLKDVESIVSSSLVTEEKVRTFLNSIEFEEENQEMYFKQGGIQLTFNTSNNRDDLLWDLDVFYWPNQDYSFEIRLGTPTESILEMNQGTLSYKTQIISEIEELMSKAQRISDSNLILFTDEASEGEFIREIAGQTTGVNYLFDLALISSDIHWDYNEAKYFKVSEDNGIKKFRSRSLNIKR